MNIIGVSYILNSQPICHWFSFFSPVGEASGKASKGLAKHIPGSGNLQNLQQQASASGSEFNRTRLVSYIQNF